MVPGTATRSVVRAGALLAAAAALAACRGGGTPEEALETFNGHLAARDFGGAADVTYMESWEGTPMTTGERRDAALASLRYLYDTSDADFGRAEIKGRRELATGVVELTVAYGRRGAPAAPPTVRVMVFKKKGPLWYYFVPVHPASHGQ